MQQWGVSAQLEGAGWGSREGGGEGRTPSSPCPRELTWWRGLLWTPPRRRAETGWDLQVPGTLPAVTISFRLAGPKRPTVVASPGNSI